MHGRKSLSPGIRFMDFTRFTEFLYLRKMASNSSQWSRQGDFLESPRWLPTDHDCAVSTRGYQSDQPSHLAISLSPALHPPRLIQISSGGESRKIRHLTRSLHIRRLT